MIVREPGNVSIHGTMVVDGAATVDRLRVGTPSDPLIFDVSNDVTLVPNSDGVVSTQHAVKSYTDTADASTLVAANAYTDTRGTTYSAPIKFHAVQNGLAYTMVNELEETIPWTTTYTPPLFTVQSSEENPSDIYNDGGLVGSRTSTIACLRGLVVMNMTHMSGGSGSVGLINFPLVPFVVPTVDGPDVALVPGSSFAGYRCATGVDRTCFMSTTVPYATTGREGNSYIYAIHIRYTTSGTSTQPIIVQYRCQWPVYGDVVTNTGTFTSISVVPSGVAGAVGIARLTGHSSGGTNWEGGPVVVCVKRQGTVDSNTNDLYILDITASTSKRGWGLNQTNM